MRILIIGKSKSACAFANYFAQNEQNIVFTTLEGTSANFIDIKHNDANELKDFALANQIDLSVLCDFSLVESDFETVFTQNNLAIVSPDSESAKIALSRGFAKRFLYKNKMRTPKFGIFDKAQMAIDYARASVFPILVQADSILENYPSSYCETFAQAKRAIENLFEMNAKQIVIENFIEGINFSLYAISDGYNVFDIDFATTYKDKVSALGASFVTSSLYKEITENIMQGTINSLAKSKKHYVGVIGFDFVMDYNSKIYTRGFYPFFKNIDANLFCASFKDTDAKMFQGAITGSLSDDLEDIEQINLNFISVKNSEGEIETFYGRTLNEAKERAYFETNDSDVFKII